MGKKSLDNIDLKPINIKSAIWYIALLYSNFDRFTKNIEDKFKSKKERLILFIKLYIIIFPYILITLAVCRFLSYYIFTVQYSKFLWNIEGLICGVIFSIVFGIVGAFIFSYFYGSIGGLFGSIVFMFVGGFCMKLNLENKIIFGLVVGLGSGLVSGLDIKNKRWINISTFMGIIIGILCIILSECNYIAALFCVLAFYFTFFRIHHYLIALTFNLFKIYSIKFYKLHPAKWDKMSRLPYLGLDKLLVSYYNENPEKTLKEIEKLIIEDSPQKINALKALTVIVTRNSSKVTKLIDLKNIINDLPEGKKRFLNQTKKIKEKVKYITDFQEALDKIAILLYQYQYAEKIEKEINQFKLEVASYKKPLSDEFINAANKWLVIAKKQRADKSSGRQKGLPEIFRAGNLLYKDNEAFIKRDSVINEIQKYILTETSCPGILLYGRRRVGKSTIIRNLKHFFPSNTKCIEISMENPLFFTSQNKHFIPNLIKKINDELDLQIDNYKNVYDLTVLMNYLNKCNEKLNKLQMKIIIMIDEYEKIDSKINEDVFNTDLLCTLRESIQKHRNITWLFAGSNQISKLKRTEWTSYLISVQTLEVEVEFFSLEETRLLLTKPLKNSVLKDIIKFDASIWGKNVVDRIYAETAGWPHLVQLVAEISVSDYNEGKFKVIEETMLEDYFDKSVERGYNVFYELLCKECKIHGEWEYLGGFSVNEFQKMPENIEIRQSLKLRKLINEIDGMWTLKVPLMRRWLKKHC